MSEDEWDVFISILRKPLPAAFRINSRYYQACDVFHLDAIEIMECSAFSINI